MKQRKKIALIDDCNYFYRYLESKLILDNCDINLTYFADSDSFIEVLANNNSDIFDLVFVDRFIKSYDIFDDDFVETCKELGYQRNIVLISTDPPANQDKKSKEGKFDFMVKKSTTTMINELKKIINGIK